mgnify:CR=1 FL=1
MEDNVWVFVCTHGRFGEELMKSAEMIAGEAENVFAFSLMPGMQPEDYRAMLEKQLEKLGDGKVLCLVDLFGGLNLAMYIEVTSQRNLRPRQELVEVGLEILRDSGKDVIKLLNERK